MAENLTITTINQTVETVIEPISEMIGGTITKTITETNATSFAETLTNSSTGAMIGTMAETMTQTVTETMSSTIINVSDYVSGLDISANFTSMYEYCSNFIGQYIGLIAAFLIQGFVRLSGFYFSLPETVQTMIYQATGVYVLFWVMLFAMIFFKQKFGTVSYRSNIGMSFVLFNLAQFFFIVYYSACILYHVASQLFATHFEFSVFLDNISPEYVCMMFFYLILASLFEYIPQGRLPTISYFIVSHTMVVNSILLFHNWHPSSLVYILCDTITMLLYPFLGSNGFYVTVGGSIVGMITASLSYIHCPYISTIMGVHSAVTLVLCVYEFRRMKERIKQNAENSKEDYKRKMATLMESAKGDKQKEAQLQQLMTALKANGYDVSTYQNIMETGSKTKSKSKTKRNNKKKKRR